MSTLFAAPFHRVLDAVRLDLPPTLTYARRSILWVPVDPDAPGWDGRCGTLTIKLQHSKDKAGARMELDTYAVEEQPEQPGLMGRSFLLANLLNPKKVDVYEVCLGPVNHCKCKAAKCRVPASAGSEGCKHRDALLALVEGGFLDEQIIPGMRVSA